ncbi:MAG: hypothetical protein EBR59_11180 [Methylococcaceae bacterium]|nr:hypothetical protein [Methylococcaceae bacterium]
MKAELLFKERVVQTENSFAELVLWRVPVIVEGSRHPFKYRLAYVVDGQCVLRYDNESGKGDHKHIGLVETDYLFTTPAQLLADFWQAIDDWRQHHA